MGLIRGPGRSCEGLGVDENVEEDDDHERQREKSILAAPLPKRHLPGFEKEKGTTADRR